MALPIIIQSFLPRNQTSGAGRQRIPFLNNQKVIIKQIIGIGEGVSPPSIGLTTVSTGESVSPPSIELTYQLLCVS